MINSLRPANAFSGDDKRCEIKFVIGGIATESIEPWILMHPAHFRRAYEHRWVNSIYFDNAVLDAYRNNLSGISNRGKVRFRWYGDLEGAEDGLFLGSCYRAESFLGSWRQDLPFGRPLAS